MRDYYISQNIGRARYVVNFHDGEKTHGDGSAFYDVRIFSNKRALTAFVSELEQSGYNAR